MIIQTKLHSMRKTQLRAPFPWKRGVFTLLVCIPLMVLLSVGTGFAQEGKIEGTVTDQTGGVVPMLGSHPPDTFKAADLRRRDVGRTLGQAG